MRMTRTTHGGLRNSPWSVAVVSMDAGQGGSAAVGSEEDEATKPPKEVVPVGWAARPPGAVVAARWEQRVEGEKFRGAPSHGFHPSAGSRESRCKPSREGAIVC